MAQPSILPPPVRGEWIPMSWEEFLDWSPDEGQSEWVDGRGIAYVSNGIRRMRLMLRNAPEAYRRYLEQLLTEPSG